MKILVLGATGMLGHKVLQGLGARHEITGTVRDAAGLYRDHPVLGGARLLGGVTADDLGTVERAIATTAPDAVINGIGVIKQLPAAKDPIPSLSINALFPHRLARLCAAAGARLVHISTDCVFSGRKGAYVETDPSDAEDLYGRTKFLGEVAADGCLTLRTSIIGRELQGRHGLVEWFLGQRGGTARGFARAIYTGFTTQALTDLVAELLERHPDVQGLWHAASNPISKYDLLGLVNEAFGLGVRIERDEDFACDRSLDGSRLRAATGFEPPDWPAMIERMAADPTPYDQARAVAC